MSFAFNTWNEKIQTFGEYFGYPKCCIDGFITKKNLKNKSYDGFIPCNSCCNRIENKEITVHDLIYNRKCGSKFVENSPSCGLGNNDSDELNTLINQYNDCCRENFYFYHVYTSVNNNAEKIKFTPCDDCRENLKKENVKC